MQHLIYVKQSTQDSASKDEIRSITIAGILMSYFQEELEENEEELEEMQLHAGQTCDEAHPEVDHDTFTQGVLIRLGES